MYAEREEIARNGSDRTYDISLLNLVRAWYVSVLFMGTRSWGTAHYACLFAPPPNLRGYPEELALSINNSLTWDHFIQ